MKARICQTLHWTGFPDSNAEFSGYTSLKTHNLDVLLRFSGIEVQLKKTYLFGWNKVRTWNPEQRYRIGRVAPLEAQRFLSDVAAIFRSI